MMPYFFVLVLDIEIIFANFQIIVLISAHLAEGKAFLWKVVLSEDCVQG